MKNNFSVEPLETFFIILWNNLIFLGRAEQSSGFYQVSDSELKVWICPLWRNITKAADQTLFDSKPADWHEDRK